MLLSAFPEYRFCYKWLFIRFNERENQKRFHLFIFFILIIFYFIIGIFSVCYACWHREALSNQRICWNTGMNLDYSGRLGFLPSVLLFFCFLLSNSDRLVDYAKRLIFIVDK